MIYLINPLKLNLKFIKLAYLRIYFTLLSYVIVQLRDKNMGNKGSAYKASILVINISNF